MLLVWGSIVNESFRPIFWPKLLERSTLTKKWFNREFDIGIRLVAVAFVISGLRDKQVRKKKNETMQKDDQ